VLSHEFRPLIFISCFPFKTSWLTLFLACNKWRYLEVFLVAWKLVIDTLQDRALWWTNNFLYLFNWIRSSDNYGLRLTYFARLNFRCYLMMIFYNRQKCNKVKQSSQLVIQFKIYNCFREFEDIRDRYFIVKFPSNPRMLQCLFNTVTRSRF
jgi:hypothetical protein